VHVGYISLFMVFLDFYPLGILAKKKTENVRFIASKIIV